MIVSFPYRILIKDNIMSEIDSALKESGLGRKCAIFCDGYVKNLLGGKISSALGSFQTDILEPESLEKSHIERVSKTCEKYDFIIGMGGGRAIDFAKYTAFLAKKEWIAFPTILSHDGVVSSRAIINENGAKMSVGAKEPFMIVADMNTIEKAPYRFLAAGAGDLISNFSAVEDWKLADKEGSEKYHAVMAKLSLLAAEAVSEHVKEIRAEKKHGIEILLWSLICSGFSMNIYGSSRPCSGSEHNFSHALEKLGSTALHGEQVALGTIISAYMQKGRWEYIQSLLKELGLPVTAEKLGIREETAIQALIEAKNVRERYTVLNKYDIDKEKAEEILSSCGIIK